MRVGIDVDDAAIDGQDALLAARTGAVAPQPRHAGPTTEETAA
ncbi:hypothetical protein AB0A63_18660 [Lentzea sp. NPDC042327]